MSEIVLKKCSKCGLEKDRDKDFLWRKHKKGKYVYRYPMPHCRECAREKSAKYRAKLKEEGKLKEAQERWEASRDPEHTNFMHRRWYRQKRGESYHHTWKKYRHEIEKRQNVGKKGEFSAKPVADFIDRFLVVVESDLSKPKFMINGHTIPESHKRALRRWRSGEVQTITLNTLDIWATSYELPFWEMEEAGKVAA